MVSKTSLLTMVSLSALVVLSCVFYFIPPPNSDSIGRVVGLGFLWIPLILSFGIEKIIGSDQAFWKLISIMGVFILGLTAFDQAMSILAISAWSHGAFLVVFLPLLILSWISYKNKRSVSKVFMKMGMPLGLIGLMIYVNSSALSFISGTPNIDSLSNSTATISHGLLPAAYGGAASLLGYFFQKDLENESGGKISFSLFPILATVFLFIWITPIATTAGILSAVDFKAFLVLGVTCLISLIMGRRKDKEVGACLSDAAIYSGVISLSFALVLWFDAGTNPTLSPIKFASVSLLYSTMLYVLVFTSTLFFDVSNSIDFSIKNWHLVETHTFFVFLVFAPVSISDYLYNEKENIEQKAIETELRVEIKNLSERLAALEKVS